MNADERDTQDNQPHQPHPVQPLGIKSDAVLRFKPNSIVRFLLDRGPEDMNSLAIMPFSDEDRVQFAQLIGYSWAGFSELSYVSEEAYDRAMAELPQPTSPTEEAKKR